MFLGVAKVFLIALLMLYTSGSTGKPKGVLHTTGGYMVWAATTFKYTFDYRQVLLTCCYCVAIVLLLCC